MGNEELHVVLLAIGRVMNLDDVTRIILDVKAVDELGNSKK